MLLVTPDDDSDTDVGLAVLVTTGVDRDDARELEVPLERGGGERSKEATRSGVDVDLLMTDRDQSESGSDGSEQRRENTDRNKHARPGLVLVEEVAHPLNGLVSSGVS